MQGLDLSSPAEREAGMRFVSCAVKYIMILALIGVGCIFTSAAFALELTSSAYSDGGDIPERYTGAGEDISPPLQWSDVPEGTESFVIIMDDIDAPMGIWVHWVIYDIPGDVTTLAEGVPAEDILPDGVKQGVNDFRRIGYGGPCPPPGSAHRYVITLYALDGVPKLGPGLDKASVLEAIEEHELGTARLTGSYQR